VVKHLPEKRCIIGSQLTRLSVVKYMLDVKFMFK